jgi:cytochrome o ubiquinol oxidase operon protein cyoD
MSENHSEHAAEGHASLGKYLIGFGLAVVLTLVSFGIVAAGLQPKYIAVIALIVAAVAQIFVHLHYFLHLDGSKESSWNMVSIVFTALIVGIFVAGTVWVIFTLNARLMG